MTEPLPQFRYHPDPVATGSIEPRDDFVCSCCERQRDYAYIGPYVDQTEDYHFANGDEICPWCIADGTAAEKWNASFIAPQYLSPDARSQMSPEALAELEFRTPSFLCLQQERWLDHHGEAAAFIAAAGIDEYSNLPSQARIAMREWVGDRPYDEPLHPTDRVNKLKNDGDGPTAYLFRCLHCDWYGMYVESG
jgi:uncharacterized protein CbrC (UPF0167 family)